MTKYILIALMALTFFAGCDFRKIDKGEDALGGGMKCGAGKCGANMFDGNSALAKKKNNLLSQMRTKDSRKECVKNAVTTKEAYECVREPNAKKLTTKCGTDENTKATPTMKCGGGMKCGGDMKCGAGKCGSSK